MADAVRAVRTPKPDLAAELLPGVSWRQVRDAFSRLRGDGPHQDALGVALSLGAIGEALEADHAPWRPTVRDVGHIESLLDREPAQTRARWPRSAAAIKAARARGLQVALTLAESGYLEKATWQESPDRGWWTYTRSARSLMARKAIVRIPRERAIALLRRAVDAAAAYNAEVGPNYHLTRLHLFGSLLRGDATVGDVDLVAETAWRWPDEPREAREAKEERRLRQTRPSGLASIIRSTELEGPKRVNRMSPHVSVVARSSMLEQLARDSEACQVVYVFVPPQIEPARSAHERKARAEAEMFLAGFK